MTHTFLLEIGLEDLPAADVIQAEKQIISKTKSFLKNANLSFGEVKGYSTPRRFAVKVQELAEKQPDETAIVRGPSKKIAQDEDGNWTQAAIGFSKGQGGSVEELIIKDYKGQSYVYLEKYIPGKSTFDILKDINQMITKIEFSKSMKWGNHSYRYIRPIHWVVALLDEDIIPFEIFGVKTGGFTYGHRFLGKKTKINRPDEYEKKLEEQFVIPNRRKRKEKIIEQIEKMCKEKDWQIPTHYTDLIEEVTDLVEYPTTFYGNFNQEFLDIPEIVLETSMIDHQRYFPVRENDSPNSLLPYFISVRNGNENHIDNVARGNEKVLSARLADATFFYHEDKKYSIDDYVNQLKDVIYYENLGSIYDKQIRAMKMAEVVGKIFNLSIEELEELKRIASIYKFDLVTNVVGEFPALQGTIGEIYANERNEAEEIGQAIGTQYLPLSANDDLPSTNLGKYIALIDKLDTLIQFFSIDLIPTGSNDPHALRRQAIGIVRLLLSLDQNNIELTHLLDKLIDVIDIPDTRREVLSNNKQKLVDFILRRLENLMEEKYIISHDIRQSVLEANHYNINHILEDGINLEEKKNDASYKDIVENITRVLNITKKQGSSGKVSEDLIETESEKNLFEIVNNLETSLTVTTSSDNKYQLLKDAVPSISEFFDHNMIMVEDKALKENRLTLLHNLANISKRYADFSQLII